jgi:ArsR family transcriptional regulator
MTIETVARQLEALGSPMRLRIYRILVRAGAEGLAVGRIQEKLGIPASTLSHHCRRLVETGLVSQDRHGTTLICRAVYAEMEALIGFLSEECCADGSLPPGEATPSAAHDA